MKDSVFNLVDLFGLTPHLFIKEKKKDTSAIGACTTIVSGLGILSIFIYYFITFLNGVGMTVISSIDNVNQPISFNLQEKLFMFKFMDSSLNPVDPRIAKMSLVNSRYEKGEIQSRSVAFESCSIDDQRLSLKKRHGNNVLSNDYNCLKKDDAFLTTLAYNNFNYSGSFLYLLLSKCTNSSIESKDGVNTTEECLPPKQIEEYLRTHTMFLSINVDDSKIDHRRKANPLDSTPFQTNIRITPYELIDTKLFWKTIEYQSDEGFFFPSWKIHQDFQFDNSLTESTIRTNYRRDVVFKSFASFEFHLNPRVVYRFEREYQKIPTYLAEISALTHVVMFLGKAIVDFFTSGIFYFEIFTVSKLTLPSNSRPTLNIRSEIMPAKEKEIGKTRLSYCNSFPWYLWPQMNKNTSIIHLAYKKIAQILSVENVINKLNMLDSLILSTSVKKPSISEMAKTPPNTKLLNVSHFKDTSQNPILNPSNSIDYIKNL